MVKQNVYRGHNLVFLFNQQVGFKFDIWKLRKPLAGRSGPVPPCILPQITYLLSPFVEAS